MARTRTHEPEGGNDLCHVQNNFKAKEEAPPGEP